MTHAVAEAVTLRIATPGDAPSIARVHITSWEVAYKDILPAEVIARWTLERRIDHWAAILEQLWPVFVLDEGDYIIGFCHVTATRDRELDPLLFGEVTSVHLLPSRRGNGLGKLLMQRALEELTMHGLRYATLWVLEENHPARGFYEYLGFTRDGATRQRPDCSAREIRYRRPLEVRRG